MEIVEKLDSIHKKLDSILFPPIICKKKNDKRNQQGTETVSLTIKIQFLYLVDFFSLYIILTPYGDNPVQS